MKMLSGSIVVLCLVIGFSSCQKEVNWNTEGITIETNDSVLLEKFVTLDTTLPAPFDSIYYLKVTYDGQKRVAAYFDIERTGSLLDTLGIGKHFYNGTDTLPYKRTYTDLGNDIVTNTYVFYDNTGRLIKDSVFSIEANDTTLEINNYSYETNRLKIDGKIKDPTGAVTNSLQYIYQTKSGNNILIQKDTTDITGAGYVRLLTYQYDNVPNPLRKIRSTHFPFYDGEDLAEDNWSTNNFVETYTERKLLSPPTAIDIDHIKYFYEYGSNGLPKVVREKEANNGTTDKYVYLYTAK